MSSALGDQDEPWPLPQRIAHGHAWGEHRFEFPEVADQEVFTTLVEQILRTGERKDLRRDRVAYWSEDAEAIVIVSPADPDGGTVFRPARGRAYFDELVARAR